MTVPISIGVEIEVNNLNPINAHMDWNIWESAGEHCGIELRTRRPAVGIDGLKKLKRSLARVSACKSRDRAGYNNAGTHLHIDFNVIESTRRDRSDLRQTQSSMYRGRWRTPFGDDKRWYWVDKEGRNWRSPKDYLAQRGRNLSPKMAFASKNVQQQLLHVKRFVIIGSRFADVLFAIQHPDRRFNKYCHTIEDWDEATILRCRSIKEIAHHPKLQQGHKRHMFNLLSFEKWGTVEVRMIRATLDVDELWAQITLFTRLAQIAKDDSIVIPYPTGLISKDIVTLLNLAGMHGKYRKILTDLFKKNTKIKNFECWCFRCYRKDHQLEFFDYGLSRAVCKRCATSSCSACHRHLYGGDGHKVDHLHPLGRKICNACYEHKPTREAAIAKPFEPDGYVFAMGTQVGSGYDGKGMRQLRRMREQYTT